MRPDIVIAIIHKIKTLSTCEQCKEFLKEFDRYTHLLDPKEVSRVKEEILGQMIRIKSGMV